MKAAVIGSETSGLAATQRLRNQAHVSVFEAGDYLDGHTRTVDVCLPDQPRSPFLLRMPLMPTTHYPEASCAQRVPWLFEAFAAPYDIRIDQRDLVHKLALGALQKTDSLGKLPIATNSGTVMTESDG